MIALCCVLCAAPGAVDMAVFAEAKEPFLRSFLTLATVCPATILLAVCFAISTPISFAIAFNGFMAQFSEQLQGVVAIDGKGVAQVV